MKKGFVMHKQSALAGIKWAIDNYPQIVIEQKFGKNPTLGKLFEEMLKVLPVAE